METLGERMKYARERKVCFFLLLKFLVKLIFYKFLLLLV